MENKIVSTVVGGIAATAVITGVMILSSWLGMPDIDYGSMLATFTNTSPAVGWIMHFITGIILAYGYVYYFRQEVPGPYPMRGMIYGILPWVITLIMLFPMMGMKTGISKAPSVGIFIVSTMIAYLAFGLVLGAIAKPARAEQANVTP